MAGHDYPDPSIVVVDLDLRQKLEILNPATGEVRTFNDSWENLRQGMVEDYAGGWLTTMADGAPQGARARITQSGMLTSEQLPWLRHCPDFGDAVWLPLGDALARGIDNLGKLDRMPKWGGGR